jgi:hypothetical protein
LWNVRSTGRSLSAVKVSVLFFMVNHLDSRICPKWRLNSGYFSADELAQGEI